MANSMKNSLSNVFSTTNPSTTKSSLQKTYLSNNTMNETKLSGKKASSSDSMATMLMTCNNYNTNSHALMGLASLLQTTSTSFRRGRDVSWLVGDGGVDLPLTRPRKDGQRPLLIHARDITTRVLEEIDCDMLDVEGDDDSTSVAHTSHSPEEMFQQYEQQLLRVKDNRAGDVDDDLLFGMSDLEPVPVDVSRMQVINNADINSIIFKNDIDTTMPDLIVELFCDPQSDVVSAPSESFLSRKRDMETFTASSSTPAACVSSSLTSTMRMTMLMDHNVAASSQTLIKKKQRLTSTLTRTFTTEEDRAVFPFSPVTSSAAGASLLAQAESFSSKMGGVGCDDFNDDANRFRPYQASQWTDRFEELIAFTKAKGHCCVPHTYQENPALARWVKR
jgi:hypothetical protein